VADEAMSLTPEQKRAVRCDDEDVMLTACPGSGKTRVIVAKLCRAIEDVRCTPRAVACITYTNAAVYEIEARVRRHIQAGDELHFDICTIHSFCLNHIFRPFCHFVKGYKQGFTVLTPESPAFQKYVSAVYGDHGRHGLTLSDFDDFAQLRRSLDGEPVGNAIDRGGVTPAMAMDYWERIGKAGLIDFANIIYYSFLLLRKRASILRYVSARFAWMLVDEFQDTTDLQVELLTLIAAMKRTRFLLVGDPFQSIFRFAGARPDLADEFAERIGARRDLTLSDNFRSSKPIVRHANLLYARTPKMEAVGLSKDFTEAPQWREGDTAFEIITDYFLPALDELGIPVGEAAILARNWPPLFHLVRSLREYGVSVVGPGARPYRRTHEFAPLAEHVCGYIMEPKPDAIAGIERALFNTVLNVTGHACFNIFSYAGRATVFRLLHKARKLHAAGGGAVAWLDAAAKAFTAILVDEEYLTPAQKDVFSLSVEAMKTDMQRNEVDLRNLTIDALGIYASPDAALKVSTIHNAKGREYQAVAIVDLHEGTLPDFRAQRMPEESAQEKRLFYVGVTRAKRFLLYVTDRSNWRGPSQFLREDGVGVY
jgi:DNA helicase II / ATP-dependent DNA helicase PcrA